MIRKLINLAIFLLIANAVYQVAPVALHQFQFKDAVHDLALFAQRETNDQIIDKVMTLAAENNVPLEREYIQIARSTGSMNIKATYVETMHFLPGFSYPWQFDVDVTVLK